MKGKLIKTDVNFLLEDDKGVVIASTSLNKEGLSLSQKNCQAIELGYDLDELAMGYDLYENINFVGQMRTYKAGFQKALELMGDKKFSEDDLKKSWSEGYHRKVDEINGSTLNYFDDLIQSLQKNEWDVEIEIETVLYSANMPKEGKSRPPFRPKLDDECCLILKRI